MNIYLDIDGVLLANELYPAMHAAEFIKYVLTKCPDSTYWLTTHCQGDASRPVRDLADKFDTETVELLKKIKPTTWLDSANKTDAIDFTKPFLWFDDDLFYKEKEKFLIKDDSNNKKKEGAIKAAADYLNNISQNSEGNQWIGLFKDNLFILEKKYYNEIVSKQLNINFLDTKFADNFSNLGELLKIFRKNCYLLNSNNEKTLIYSPLDFLKKIVEEGKKFVSIQRFKGLGEMNPEELWETTLDPANNTLLRVNYSNNDADADSTNPGDQDREIFKILMGEDVVPRKDFINKYAISVDNLDI